MRLLRLEASGFKSFCDKAIVNFVQNGISIVVGPNGCGKSNIVDAIRWTLGEQSAKHLRGASMEDVIFSGSSGRQPVSMAQVTLVFSNPEHDTVPKYSEFSEISVTRRLYRSGESQYLINKTPCRLTDIRELFMDTGIGGKGYSIIEQGKIDQIITSRAEDRRAIIDEAAGIMKFKSKRKEAERKFAATKQNLLRVEDVLAELKRQEESLVVQVARAEEYLAAKSRFERLQNCIAATRWYHLKKQAEKLGANREKNLEQHNDLLLTISGLETRESTLSLEITKNSADLDDRRKIQQDQKEAIIKLESRLESDKAALTNLDEWEHKTKSEAAIIEKQIKTVELQLNTYQSDQKKTQEEIQDKSSIAKRLQEAEETSDSELTNQKLRLKNLQQNEVEAISKVSSETTELGQIQERLNEAKEKQKSIVNQQKNLESEQNLVQTSFDDLIQKIESKKKEKEKIQASLNTVQDQKEEKEEKLRSMVHKITSVQQEIHQTESRLQSLEELVLSHEEYDTSTKRVLDFMANNANEAEKLGFLGTLAELIVLPDEMSTQALGFLNRYFNLLVFSSSDHLKDIIQLVQQEELEQLHFCFLDLVTSAEIDSEVSLSSVIPYKDKIPALPFIESFKSLEQPIYTLSNKELQQAEALIDKEGSIMTKAKIFLVGQPGKSNLAESFIKRRAEISELSNQLEAAQKQFETLEQMQEEESELLDELARSVKSNLQHLVDLDLEIVGLEKEFDGKSLEKQRINNEANSVAKEQDQIAQLINQFKETVDSLEKSIETNNQRKETIQKVCLELQSQIEKTESSREETTSELQQLKVNLAALEEKQANNSEAIERLSRDLEDRKSQKEEILAKSSETVDKRKLIVKAMKQAEKDLPKMLSEIEIKEKNLNKLRDEIEAAKIQHMELQEKIKSEVGKIGNLKDRNHKLDVKLAQLAQEAKNIEDNLFLENSLKPEDLLQTFNADEFDIEKESETISELKKKIGSMTNINLAAKGEYDKLKERLDFLDSQSVDLTQSMEALENSITKINQESRKRFRTTFQQVNERFSKLFPELFGGGEAYLRLTDEEDILESGVDIIAQPPGKKLQNMTLLSGGEKALTAIALIFAVFMIKPSPFCLLDEVDAPLDDANNVRFNTHVKALTENSQFIIITHNKKTMEIGDALFGITMEEPGISKVVSVDFSTFQPDTLQKAV